MEYPTGEKEFYELMETKRTEIKSLDIPEEEREKLYSEVERTIKGFEESKARDFYLHQGHLISALDKFGEGLGKVLTATGEIAEKNDARRHILRINQQISDYKMKRAKEQIVAVSHKAIESEENFTAQLGWIKASAKKEGN